MKGGGARIRRCPVVPVAALGWGVPIYRSMPEEREGRTGSASVPAAIQMQDAEGAGMTVIGQGSFKRVLCQRRLHPQPAQQQHPDCQCGTTHRPQGKGAISAFSLIQRWDWMSPITLVISAASSWPSLANSTLPFYPAV